MSVGRLVAPAPGEDVVKKLMQAAGAAPDHGKLRPWRFIVFEGEGIKTFGDVMAASLKRKNPAADEVSLAQERKKAERAPMIIVAVALARESTKIPRFEQLLSTGAAVQNLLLAAHALGFGTMWRTGDVAFDKEAMKAIGLAPGDEIAGTIYIGSLPQPVGRAQPAEAAPVSRG
jgi:nitroreductase